jgi:hypothetical protein
VFLIVILVTFPVLASQLFLDESTFLSEVTVPLKFESFENLPLDPTITQSTIDVDGFTLVSQSNRLGVRNHQLPGIDGTQFVIYAQENNSTLSLLFDTPTNVFGTTLVDALDGNGTLSMSTNSGDNFDSFLVGPLQDENVAFLGIIADEPFTVLSIDHTHTWRDGIVLDAVHFSTVPAPGAAWLFLSAIIGFSVLQRRILR